MKFKVTKTERGFEHVKFEDAYGDPCHLTQSSAILGDDDRAWTKPGSSAIWLGVDDAKPMILASVAPRFGMETDKTTGWIDYEIPDEVLLHTSMHLNREQVKELIDRLQKWLESGSFTGKR